MATERNPSFFKVLQGDQFSNKLKIPNAFLQCFNGRVPPHCLLQSRGRSWIVYVEKVDHKYYFQHGWNGFVQGNGINCGEFLLFHYAGNSRFHVQIFGTNTCKKLHVLPEMKEANEHDDGDESPDILDYFPPCPRKTEDKSLLSSLPPYKSNEASSSGKADITLKFRNKFPNLEKSAMKKKKGHWFKSKSAMKKKKGHWFKSKMINFSDNDSGDEDDSDETYYEDDGHDEEVDEESADDEEEETEDEDKEEEDDDSVEFLNDSPGCSRRVRRYTLASRVHKRKRKSSTAKAKNKIKAVGGPSREEKYGKLLARQIANTFKSDSVNPCFVVSMCATYASGIFLRLPQSFVMEHLINLQPSCFTLRVGKICWSVKVLYREATILGAGWSKFVHANNLKFGDACAFVMTNAIKFEFDVEIFRGTDAIRT